MAEVKGKLISLTGTIAKINNESVEEIDEFLEEETGYTHMELDPEEFFPAEYWGKVIDIYASAHDDKARAIINLGKRIYPTLKRTMDFPAHLKTPQDWLRFIREGFIANHRGDDVIPREIVEETENSVTIYAPATPGYDEHIYHGAWLGILEMIGITTGKIETIKEGTYKVSW